MGSWTVYNFECADVAARDALMERIADRHPVTFPAGVHSVFDSIGTGDGTCAADYAWVDRYLYVTVLGSADGLFGQTVDRWDRAARATFDSVTETATDVTFVADTAAGGDDEVEASRFNGAEGMAGLDVMYGLAMLFEFRFRAYAAASPTTQLTPHPGAFDTPADVVGDLDEFVAEMAAATGVDATDVGLALLRDDPARDHGTDPSMEAEGPTDGRDDGPDGTDAGGVTDSQDGNDGQSADREGADQEQGADREEGAGGGEGVGDRSSTAEPNDAAAEHVSVDANEAIARRDRADADGRGAGIDAIHVVDGATGEISTFESADEVPDDPDGDDAGLMARFRQLLGG